MAQQVGKKKLFTPQMIERLRPPSAGRLEIADSNCPGLVLRVTDQGTKTLAVIFKVPGEGGVSTKGRLMAGRQHRITLGRWPGVGLKEARDKARIYLSDVTEGRNPKSVLLAQNSIRHTNTVDAVVERFIAQECKGTVRSWANIDRVLRLHVLPVWGSRPLRDIRRSDVHALLDGLVEQGKLGTGREVRKHLSKLFNWALDRELVQENPVASLKRRDLASEEAGRALSDDELKALWQATGELGYPFGPMFRMLMLTGQRRSEWAKAQRSEIDTANRWLEVPRGRYKGARDHVVPLSEAAWQAFESLPAWTGKDYFLFSSRGGKAPVSGFTQGKRRLDELATKALRTITGDPKAKLAPYRIHDLRVTCETRLANLGFGREVRDAVLGHAKPGLQKTYNKHDYLDEKRAALEGYARHLMEMVA